MLLVESMGSVTKIAPVWAWAEANQGLLGFIQGCIALLALGIALFALFNERRSAARAAEARLREYVDFVLALLDSLSVDGDRAIERFVESQDPTFITPTYDWLPNRNLTAAALKTATAAPPPDPRLAVLIAELLGAWQTSPAYTSRAGAEQHLKVEVRELRRLREAIAQRRCRPDRS